MTTGSIFTEPPVARAAPTKNGNSLAPARRLRRLRKRAGYKTVRAAAFAIGCSCSIYNHHENGIRAISRQAAERYGKFYGVPAGEILYGETLQITHAVPIVGTAEHDGWIKPLVAGEDAESADPDMPYADFTDTPQGRIEWFSHPGCSYSGLTVQAPPGVTLKEAREMGAVRIDSTVYQPMFMPGDVLYYRPAKYDRRLIHGRRCIVLTEQGELCPRLVMLNEDGSCTLEGLGALSSITLRKTCGVWPILWTKHFDPSDLH